VISAIILAAGTSSRMGKPKLLLPFKGRSIIRVVAENVLASLVDEVLVVTGCYSNEVTGAIKDLPVRIVNNPDYKKGQGTSLATGARWLSPETEAFLVFMGDQPLISPAIINSLINEFRKNKRPALRPVYNGQPGHPVIFDCSLISQVKLLQGDEGARKVLGNLRKDQVEFSVPYPEVVFDVDTPEAYKKLTSLYPSSQI
jgi:molybdenum cofactor cytidylyltransferase